MRISQNDRIKAKEVLKRFHKDKSPKEVFYDLCFCICAPQTTFKSNLKVNSGLRVIRFFDWEENMFDTIGINKLEEIVKPARFYRNKTKWLIELKKKFRFIYDYIAYAKAFKASSVLLRNWLIENVKGLGMKAASHFLRNQGYTDLAVIDVHILRFLNDCGYLVDMNMSKEVYLHLEGLFIHEAKKKNLSPAELDAIIWKQRSKTEWKDFVY